MLTDSRFAGVSALHRPTRDVIGQPGAKVVINLEGVNDIGLHPNDVGYPVMGDAIPLSLLLGRS